MKKLSRLLALSVLTVGGVVSLASCDDSTSSSVSVSSGGSEGSSETVSSAEGDSSESTSSARAESSAGDPNGTHLRMWIAKADLDALTNLVTAYNTKYPQDTIYVTGIEMAEGDIGNNIGTDPDALPDVMHVPGDVLTRYQDSETFYAIPQNIIDEYAVDSEGNVDLTNAVLESGKRNNVQLGLPFSINTFYLYYDTRVFSAEDFERQQDFEAALRETQTQFGYDMSNGWYTQNFFMSKGGIFEDNGTSLTDTHLDTDDALQVAKTIQYMYQNSDIYFMESQANQLNRENLSAYASGTWDYPQLVTKWGKENVGMTVLPHFNIGGTSTQILHVGDYKAVAVANSSSNKEDASKFAAFLVSEEGQKIRFEGNGGGTCPTSSALADDPEFAKKYDFGTVLSEVQQLTFQQNTSAKFAAWWDAATAFANAIKADPNMSEADLRTKLNDLQAAILA